MKELKICIIHDAIKCNYSFNGFMEWQLLFYVVFVPTTMWPYFVYALYNPQGLIIRRQICRDITSLSLIIDLLFFLSEMSSRLFHSKKLSITASSPVTHFVMMFTKKNSKHSFMSITMAAQKIFENILIKSAWRYYIWVPLTYSYYTWTFIYSSKTYSY